MTNILLIAGREMRAYARSPLGSVIVAGALLINGIVFYYYGLSQKLLSAEVLSEFFWAASGVTMISSIALSMRLIAEERQTHTFTLLNTAPIFLDWEIVLGKYLSAFGMVAILIVLTLYMPALIFVNGKVSLGHIVVGYAGLLLIGSATTAIGLFASALTRSQVVAVIVGAAILAALILLWMLASAIEPPLNGFFAGLAFHHQNFMPFQKGVLELRGVAYYLGMTYFFLISATKVLEARRWR